MAKREFVYVGESLPMLTEAENAEFLLLIRKAVIFSLEKRQLLTMAQRKRCVEMLEIKSQTALKGIK